MLRVASRKTSFRKNDTFRRNDSGASAVEFALISPLLLLMLAGIVDYGTYFSTAHAVQQMANDAARAAIAGTTAQQRLDLVQGIMSGETGHYGFMTAGHTGMAMEENSQLITVTLTFTPDSDHFDIFPMPPGMPATIIRSASIVRGGY